MPAKGNEFRSFLERNIPIVIEALVKLYETEHQEDRIVDTNAQDERSGENLTSTSNTLENEQTDEELKIFFEQSKNISSTTCQFKSSDDNINVIKKKCGSCGASAKGDILNIPIAIAIHEEKKEEKGLNWTKFFKSLLCCYEK